MLHMLNAKSTNVIFLNIFPKLIITSCYLCKNKINIIKTRLNYFIIIFYNHTTTKYLTKICNMILYLCFRSSHSQLTHIFITTTTMLLIYCYNLQYYKYNIKNTLIDLQLELQNIKEVNILLILYANIVNIKYLKNCVPYMLHYTPLCFSMMYHLHIAMWYMIYISEIYALTYSSKIYNTMVHYLIVIIVRNRNTMYHTAICNIEKYIASTYADTMYPVTNDYKIEYSIHISYIPHREYYLIYYVFRNILTIYLDAMCFPMICYDVEYSIVTSDVIKLWYYTTCTKIGNMINTI